MQVYFASADSGNSRYLARCRSTAGLTRPMNDLILYPILFMGTLSFVMMFLMYATRIPAAKVLEAQGVDLQKLSHPSQLGGVFPSHVERVADNYNHLWEQPTPCFTPSLASSGRSSMPTWCISMQRGRIVDSGWPTQSSRSPLITSGCASVCLC